MSSSAFEGTSSEANKSRTRFRSHGDKVGRVTSISSGCLPAMSLKDTTNVCLAVELGVISSLMDVETRCPSHE